MAEALGYETAVGGGRGEVPLDLLVTTDERPLRDELRRQIARLEQQLSELWTSAFPRKGIDWSVGAVGGPRILGAAELERIRDALLTRIREAQTEIARRADVEERNRGLVEDMIAEPASYPWVQISNEDVGDRDCKHWHSRPRFGILGMLLGWWRVKLSSGCPLAEGLAAPNPQMAKKRKKRPRRPREAAPVQPKPVASSHAAERKRAAAEDTRPPAPWGSFPLVEICVLIGIALVIVGLVMGAEDGALAIGVGIGLAALGGLELAIREHFAGFRSHSSLLAGVPAIAALGLLFYAGPDSLEPVVMVGIGAAVFAGAFFGFQAMFKRKAGVAVKIR